MNQYLLDTNIIIFYIRGQYDLEKKFKSVGIENCFISEITLAELLHGAEKSHNPSKNLKIVEEIQNNISLVPIFNSLRTYAKEKSRLETLGTPVDDFDLLIGATAIANNLILVTNNTKHFKRMDNLTLEDWII